MITLLLPTPFPLQEYIASQVRETHPTLPKCTPQNVRSN